MSILAELSRVASLKATALRDRLSAGRTAFGLPALSIASSHEIAEAIEAVIEARLKERDEAWLKMIREVAAENGLDVCSRS